MVQGALKGLQNKKGNSSRHAAKAAASTKKGKRYVAPKKAAAVKSAALHKVRLHVRIWRDAADIGCRNSVQRLARVSSSRLLPQLRLES